MSGIGTTNKMASHRMLQCFSKFSSQTLKQAGAPIRIRVTPRIQAAFISTSEKNRDTTTAATGHAVESAPKTVQDFANPSEKNYQHFGFDPNDRDWDINIRNATMFFTITIGIVLTGFFMTYGPQRKLKDWTVREAYIELARREALGLPPIDRNYVPEDQVELPTDEELGDFEIII